MPKHQVLAAKCDFRITPETALTSDLMMVLQPFFAGALLEDLQRRGGTITIHIAPASERKGKISELDRDFVRFISSFRGDERELRERLDPLLGRQLKFVAKELNIPLPSNASSKDVVGAIVSYVMSSRRWTGISGVAPAAADSDAKTEPKT